MKTEILRLAGLCAEEYEKENYIEACRLAESIRTICLTGFSGSQIEAAHRAESFRKRLSGITTTDDESCGC